MTSAPRGFRSKGRPGDRAVVDEAAFVDDLAEVLKAALAFLMWGGSVHVMSTHNGEGSPFATLVRDVREDAQPGSLHRVTFADAVAEGLCRRIFELAGRALVARGRGRLGGRDPRQLRPAGRRGARTAPPLPAPGAGCPGRRYGRAKTRRPATRPATPAGRATSASTSPGATISGSARFIEIVGDVKWLRQIETMQNRPCLRTARHGPGAARDLPDRTHCRRPDRHGANRRSSISRTISACRWSRACS